MKTGIFVLPERPSFGIYSPMHFGSANALERSVGIVPGPASVSPEASRTGDASMRSLRPLPCPPRLPLHSFRGSSAVRFESSDFVHPSSTIPPVVPIPGFSRRVAGIALDRELVALSAADARCRLLRARITERLIATRAWRALGFVRLSDFARERFGVSPRSLEDDAHVMRALDDLPALRACLEAGELSWTRLKVLLRVATPRSERMLLEASRSVPMRELDEFVRGFETDSAIGMPGARAIRNGEVSAAVADDPLVRLSLDLSRTGRRLWRATYEYASRSAGSPLSPGQVLELVVAEVAAGVPSIAADEASANRGIPPELHERRLREGIRIREARGRRDLLRFLTENGAAEGFPWLAPASRDPGPAAAVEALLDGLARADAFELERRLQELRLLTQRLETQMAALLRTGIDHRLFREIGFATVKLYAEARLGVSVRRVWSLVAIERKSGSRSRPLQAAWREGQVTLLQATTLLSVPGEQHAQAWIRRAGEVTLRRLQDEVAWALDRGQEEPPPPDTDLRSDGMAGLTDGEVQNRAHGPAPQGADAGPGAVRLEFVVPLSAAVLLESTLDRLQGRGEERWHAFERMLALALVEWRGAPRHRDPIFDRDGWRCAVPGCSSRRNLQDHHVVFRSRGGGNARDNRITVCAAHHLHGIHEGIVRVRGTAPHGLEWEVGCARGRGPLMRLAGDRYL